MFQLHSSCITKQGEKIIISNEQIRILKQKAMTYFKVLFLHLPGKAKENQNSR